MLSTGLKSHNLAIRVVSLFLATLVLSSASIGANNVAPTISASLPVSTSPSVAPKITIISHPTVGLPSKAPAKVVAPAPATKLVIRADKTDAPLVIHAPVAAPNHKILHVPSSPAPVATLNVTGAGAAAAVAHAVHAAAATSAPAPTGAPIIVKPAHPLGEHSNEITHKFCDFLKPICESVDKIPPKQLFQIQTQFKKIVQSSAGKLSFCFLEHYKVNPNLKPITKAELTAVCSSKNLAPELKGSYKAFQACASKNWDQNVDEELDHIEADRLEFIKSHKHAKNDSNVENLVHEDDEFSLISEVIGQVLDNKSLSNRSDVKLIDFSSAPTTVKPAAVVVGPAKATTVSPVLVAHPSTIPVTVAASVVVKQSNISTSAPTSVQGVKDMMNDPNTVLVLVDDSNATTLPSTLPPILVKKDPPTTVKTTILLATSAKPTVKISIAATTAAPAATISIESSKNKTKTTSKSGSLAEKLVEASIPTTMKPLVVLSSSAKPTVVTTSTNTSVTISAPTTTSAPSLAAALVGNSTVHPTTVHPTTVAAKVIVKSKLEITNSTTIKPLKAIQTVLVKQEKEKENLETKLKLEREKVMKDFIKKQDEIDAQNAIKALQAQRQAQFHADIKLHQIEHEHQMQIDPIGHLIKHQQYEISKQQKMQAGGK